MARQAPLSMGVSRLKYCSGLPFPSPTVSWNLLKFMSIELVMLSNYLLYIHTQTHMHTYVHTYTKGAFPGDASGKEPACQCKRRGFDSWVGKIPWRMKWLPLKYHAWRIPWTEGPGRLYSPEGPKESDMTEWLSTHTEKNWEKGMHTRLHIYARLSSLPSLKENEVNQEETADSETAVGLSSLHTAGWRDKECHSSLWVTVFGFFF